MKKLAIVITHPIQYYVPLFQLLAQNCDLKVFYTWGKDGAEKKYDPGFGKEICWDLPLQIGYNYIFLKNISKAPGSHHGKGIINPTLINDVELFSPDAILIYGYIYNSHFKVMRHFKGKIPIWFRGDSTLLDRENFIKSTLKRFYLKYVYKNIDKAFYVGSNNKAYFKKYGVKESQLIFAPHAVDNNRFGEDRKEEALELRKQLGISVNESLILFAGKLEPKKAPELLLEAFLELQPKETHILFVGNGVLEDMLKSKCKKLSYQVHFINFQNQSEMPLVYQACDLFCLPSQGPGETWGLAINEAMASGRAVIASNKVGCAIDLVKNGINGYIFESGNKEELKQKLEVMLKSNLKEMGYASLNIIKQWSLESQASTFFDELNNIK